MGTAALKTSNTWIGLVVALAACLGVGAIGSIFTAQGLAEWYVQLRKPTWNPPSWVFGPVWTMLYIGMAVAVWRVWTRTHGQGSSALAYFGVQLALNLVWSALFFGMRNSGLAAVEIVMLWAAILGTLISFAPIDRVAALLLAPYLAWVSFAAVLNVTIWRLNS